MIKVKKEIKINYASLVSTFKYLKRAKEKSRALLYKINK
tara:strand:+ start:1466 stop:1582 length:117 start_codon:yes stop_codon:yes gene_type:complete